MRTAMPGHARAGRCLATRSLGCPLCIQRAEAESCWVCAGACASQQAALSVRARSQRRLRPRTQSRRVQGSPGRQAGTRGVARLRRGALDAAHDPCIPLQAQTLNASQTH